MNTKKAAKRYKLAEKLPFSESTYHALVGVLIGVGFGLMVLGLVAFATKDSRPTQYILQLIQEKFGF